MKLSGDISITIHTPPSVIVLRSQQGNYQLATSTSQTQERSIQIDYRADQEIFGDFELDYHHITSFLSQFALLNRGLKIISLDQTGEETQRQVFYSPSGIFQQVDSVFAQLPFTKSILRLDIETQQAAYCYQIGLCYHHGMLEESYIKTYAGNIETWWGGSLLDGVLDGLVLAIQLLAQQSQAEIRINRKLAKQQLILIAAVKGEPLIFVGGVKGKLGVPQLRKDVKKLIVEQLMPYFQANPEVADNILTKFGYWD